MEKKSQVYFTDFRIDRGDTITKKMQRLMEKAGIGTIDFDGKFVAIKMHFGELGNLSFLRPNYAKAVADLVKSKGGKPFLTDCNTLYPGFRKNALEHMDCAEENGFSEASTGCHIIIGDGLRGTDEVDVPIHNGTILQEAHIGHAIMDADVFIALTHFKGHEETGFGGTIKNIGMGCGSRAGKMAQHCEGKPKVDLNRCRGCKRCAKECGSDAISYPNGKCVIDKVKCKGCGRCIGACAFDAISPEVWNANGLLGEKIAEYSMAVTYGRPCFYINVIRDVSPNCDCCVENDAPIIPNIGMLCSFDQVALDQASVDLCNKAEPISNSQIGDNEKKGAKLTGNLFHDSNPQTDSESALRHGEEIGLGSRSYDLIIMK